LHLLGISITLDASAQVEFGSSWLVSSAAVLLIDFPASMSAGLKQKTYGYSCDHIGLFSQLMN
jgi:hypothetical protein